MRDDTDNSMSAEKDCFKYFKKNITRFFAFAGVLHQQKRSTE